MKLLTSGMAPAVLLIAVGITACSAPPATTELTLRDTKVPAQLLRNEAAQRLLEDSNDSIAEQEDYSASCKSGAEDPDALYRSWRSTLLASVPPESAIGVDQFMGELATSFAVDGWVLSENHGTDSSLKVTTMTKTSSFVTLTFTSTEDTGDGASVYIEATGPCVLTGGPDSAEVAGLEE